MAMLRQTRAEVLALLTGVLVVLLAALFAWLRNVPVPAMAPPEAPTTSAPAGVADPRLDQGRRAFERLNCAMCHAVAGRGNPASPLDGVGGRMDPAAIRAWTTGTGIAREQLPPGIVRMKTPAATDPDLDALVDYLATRK